MTAIRSFAEILLTNRDLDPEQRQQFVNTIHDESMRLTGLLEEILDLNALERGEKLWTNHPINPNLALKRAIKVCTPVTNQHNMQVRLGNMVEDVQVVANFDRICQVFINLISNAAKYNDAKEPFVLISSQTSADKLLVDFIDNGPGIPPANRHTIFDKFWRGARNPETSQSGSGLGLAISREILGNMNGSLNLIKTPDEIMEKAMTERQELGACFRVTLPLHTG